MNLDNNSQKSIPVFVTALKTQKYVEERLWEGQKEKMIN